MKCTQCDYDNPVEAQFCGGCGTNLIAGEAYVGTELPMVGFGEAVSRGFRNYFTFSGRATRAESWWWVLFTVLAGIVLAVVDTFTGTMGMFGDSGLLGGLFELATLIPSLALGARRLHDINRTGWWLFLVLGFFPMAAIGGGILLVSFFLLDNLLILTVLGFTMVIGFGILGIIGIIVLIVWAIKRGDKGPNKYGPDPRQDISHQSHRP
jgi:uncharacterized membrane protein YhaH (DUF805 family)